MGARKKRYASPDEVPANQLHITSYMVPKAVADFLRQRRQNYSWWTYLGYIDGLCYFRDDGFYNFEAYNPEAGTRIGNLTLDDECFLSGVYVDAAYQRKGIGKQLIAFANRTTTVPEKGTRLVIAMGQQYNSRYRLTAEGMCLILSCKRNGILQHDQLLQGHSIPTPNYDGSASPAMGGYMVSPPHASVSPAYVPTSPHYAPTSPSYSPYHPSKHPSGTMSASYASMSPSYSPYPPHQHPSGTMSAHYAPTSPSYSPT